MSEWVSVWASFTVDMRSTLQAKTASKTLISISKFDHVLPHPRTCISKCLHGMHSHTLSHTHSHTHTLTLTLTHILTHSLTHSHSHSHREFSSQSTKLLSSDIAKFMQVMVTRSRAIPDYHTAALLSYCTLIFILHPYCHTKSYCHTASLLSYCIFIVILHPYCHTAPLLSYCTHLT